MADTNVLDTLGLSPSFFFADQPQTSDSIKARREAILKSMIAARMQKSPQTLGEGISTLGNAVGDRMFEARTNAMEQALLKGDQAARTGAPPLQPQNPSAQPRIVPQGPYSPAARPAAAAPVQAGPPVSIATTRPAEPPPGAPMAPGPIDQVTGALMGGAPAPAATPGGGQPNPTLPGAEPPVQAAEFLPSREETPTAPTTPTRGPTGSDALAFWGPRQDAIGGIETGGTKDPYATVGVETNGDRPYGRYQMMGRNIPQWSQAALGYTLTPQQFLEGGKAVQDAIFQHRFGQYIDKYGDAGAARAWFAGEGNMNNLNGRDRLGTTVGSYGNQYIQRLGAMIDASSGSGAAADDGEATAYDEGGGVQPTRATGASQPRRTIAGAIDPLSGLLMPSPMNPRTGGAPPATGGPTIPGGGASVPAGQPPAPLGNEPQMLPDPGPEPIPEPPTARMEYWRKIAMDPFRSDILRAEAKDQYEREKTLQDAAFTRRYERWKDLDTKYREKVLGLPAERIKLQKDIADLEKTRIYENNGTYYVLDNGRLRDITPGSDPTGDKPPQVQGMTGEEGKNLTYHRNAITALNQFNRVPDADKILAQGLKDEMAGRLPFFGNAAMSDKYRIVRSAADAIVNASLRSESGAAFSASELSNKYRNIIPVYGDDAQTLANKRQLREGVAQGLYEGLAKARPIADWQKNQIAKQNAKEDAAKADKDREAVQWARDNPNDPRAAKILKAAGGR